MVVDEEWMCHSCRQQLSSSGISFIGHFLSTEHWSLRLNVLLQWLRAGCRVQWLTRRDFLRLTTADGLPGAVKHIHSLCHRVAVHIMKSSGLFVVCYFYYLFFVTSSTCPVPWPPSVSSLAQWPRNCRLKVAPPSTGTSGECETACCLPHKVL